MQALVLSGPGQACLARRPVPSLKEGHALMKVEAASLCGSDINAYLGRGMELQYPLVLGHEVAGTVVEASRNRHGILPGDRVVLDPYLYCGKCYPCSLGKTNCCESLKVLGVQTDGAMSGYFLHPLSHLHKIPDSLPIAEAPIAEPLVIALHGLRQAGASSGEHVVIIGAGPVGILAALACLQYGAIPVLVDILQSRLQVAQSLGIPFCINPDQEDAVKSIHRITKGRMAEVVLEMSGSHRGIQNSLLYASHAARVSLTGWPSGETYLDTGIITKKELCINGSRTGAGEFGEAISLLASKKIDASKLISKVVPSSGLPAAIQAQASDPGGILKIVAVFE